MKNKYWYFEYEHTILKLEFAKLNQIVADTYDELIKYTSREAAYYYGDTMCKRILLVIEGKILSLFKKSNNGMKMTRYHCKNNSAFLGLYDWRCNFVLTSDYKDKIVIPPIEISFFNIVKREKEQFGHDCRTKYSIKSSHQYFIYKEYYE